MKLLKLTCPSCGAKLEVNSSLEKYTCNYCGTTTLLDKEEIIIKYITSEFETKLYEIEEYYENGNKVKARELALELIKKYPKNKKLIAIINDTEDVSYILNNREAKLNYRASIIAIIIEIIIAWICLFSLGWFGPIISIVLGIVAFNTCRENNVQYGCLVTIIVNILFFVSVVFALLLSLFK